MPYVYSNNGLSFRWADPGENYQPQAGEIILDPGVLGHDIGAADIRARFPGYDAAVGVVAASAQASTTLAQKLAAGIAITCTGNAALTATYALDDQTMTEIGAVARDAAAGLGLPGGGATFTYPDIASQPRTFTSVQLQALYKAMRDLILQIRTQARIASLGGAPAWPVQSATIA